MSQGFAAARELGGRKFIETKTKQVTRPPHPELVDVKPGDELMVVNFTPDPEFTQKVKESDSYLHQSLRDRIEEINEDEDEDDGGALVPAVPSK
tara:strand:- start:2493 stop:2774 length:282 start_codon:yes stop_codon:yes gene_type:complete